MTSLRFEDLILPGADLGEENCNADISSQKPAKRLCTERITEEDLRYVGAGDVHTILPYTMQDGYDRNKRQKCFKAAVLENDFLKAVFIPELGGRLWSLYNKT